MHRFSFSSIFVLMLVLGSTIFIGAFCTREQPMKVEPVTLEYWHAFDDEQALQQIAADLKQRYPYISVNFRRFGIDEYEQKLLNALAAGTGPDLFSLKDTWVSAYGDKVLPLPPELTIPTFTVEGGISKTTVAHPSKEATIRPSQIRDLFVDVVADTVLRPFGDTTDKNIVGLPLALDTMALYVNRQLLAQAQVPEPPTTWDELLVVTPKLTRTDVRGAVLQSAISLGGGMNIDRAADILALLMMQSGVLMTDDRGGVDLQHAVPGVDRSIPPAENALGFYTDFADPTKGMYTWDVGFPEALTAFTSGRSAMFFGYAYHLPLIRARAPRMNLVVKPMLQIAPGTRVDYANFWVTSVSKQTQHPHEAWKFLLFAATDRAQAFQYAKTARRPVALRSLIDMQRNDPEQEDMRVFVDAVLTARNWYRGTKHGIMEDVFRQMITLVVDRVKAPREAIDFGEQRLRE